MFWSVLTTETLLLDRGYAAYNKKQKFKKIYKTANDLMVMFNLLQIYNNHRSVDYSNNDDDIVPKIRF